jgi:hypothetical protein
MRLFYIAPWPAADPLSSSTVLPHLSTLVDRPCLHELTYFSTEADQQTAASGSSTIPLPKGVAHRSLHADVAGSPPFVRRIRRHRQFCLRLLQEARRQRPDLVICRGTTGVYGDLLLSQFRIPYVVESFEPHAHYMLQTRTWRRWDPKFLVQRRWEQRVKRSAAALITVSHGYARHLQQRERIEASRLHTVPCWMNADRFRIDPEARNRIRQQLGIGDRLAVIYCGKFGGIYSPLPALAMLSELQRALNRSLFVLILTSHPRQPVIEHLRRCGFASDQLLVDCMPHDCVPDYLNAADLAVSFINSGPWSFACSAIKHAEAWACGLPVLMPPGVGDEATWLEAEGAGAIADFAQPRQIESAARKLAPILREAGHRQRIRAIALRERSPEPMRRTYQLLLDRFAPA